jgi:hypothetical protein
VSASSTGTATDRQDLVALLKSVAEDASKVSNTKVKRKVSRLIQTLEAAQSEPPAADDTKQPNGTADGITAPSTKADRLKSSASNTTVSVAPAAANAPPLVTGAAGIEAVLRQLRTVHSADELDAVLVTLDLRTVLAAEGQENAASDALAPQRRQLKRSIEAVLAQEEVEKTMNAKVRRRVNRITAALTEASASGDDDHNQDGGELKDQQAADGSNSSKRSNADGLVIPAVTGTIVNSTTKKVPHVVFVGNLSYDTTASDLEQHLRSTAALEGAIKVRLRTNAETGQSLGIAFVDLEGARELHQCVSAAHHTALHGRIINVEKSCGGRNKTQRGEKIAAQRTEQRSRAEEAVNRVLMQYEKKGVLQSVHKWGATLKESVYAHSPAHLSEVHADL